RPAPGRSPARRRPTPLPATPRGATPSQRGGATARADTPADGTSSCRSPLSRLRRRTTQLSTPAQPPDDRPAPYRAAAPPPPARPPAAGAVRPAGPAPRRSTPIRYGIGSGDPTGRSTPASHSYSSPPTSRPIANISSGV